MAHRLQTPPPETDNGTANAALHTDDTLPPNGDSVSSEEAAQAQARFCANMHPGRGVEVPTEFALLVKQLEDTLNSPIILLVQNSDDEFGEFSIDVLDAFFQQRHSLERGVPVTVLVDSPGGVGKYAYQIARLLRNHCGQFNVVVPRYAKSAATLFSLGADSILMGENAELGPLDAQIRDPDPEKGQRSALDEVQTLERLHAAALESVDQCMIAWARRSGKKLDVLLPIACKFVSGKFVSDMMRPLHEKIDSVNFTQMSRTLRDAEFYAIRLLRPRHHVATATKIASRLVGQYPVHSFRQQSCLSGLMRHGAWA